MSSFNEIKETIVDMFKENPITTGFFALTALASLGVMVGQLTSNEPAESVRSEKVQMVSVEKKNQTKPEIKAHRNNSPSITVSAQNQR